MNAYLIAIKLDGRNLCSGGNANATSSRHPLRSRNVVVWISPPETAEYIPDDFVHANMGGLVSATPVCRTMTEFHLRTIETKFS